MTDFQTRMMEDMDMGFGDMFKDEDLGFGDTEHAVKNSNSVANGVSDSGDVQG